MICIVRKNGGEFLRPVESGEHRWETVPLSVVRTKVKQARGDMAFSLSPQPSSKPFASMAREAASRGSDEMTLSSLLAAPTPSLPICAFLNPSPYHRLMLNYFPPSRWVNIPARCQQQTATAASTQSTLAFSKACPDSK